MRCLILTISLVGSLASAEQEVKLVNPDLFCKVEQFTNQKGKAASGNYKRCNSLKDKEDVPVKSISECKQRALAKGEECLKLSRSNDLAVVGKFMEKFAVSFNSTSFTCALSEGAGNECP